MEIDPYNDARTLVTIDTYRASTKGERTMFEKQNMTWDVAWYSAGHCKDCNRDATWHVEGTYESRRAAEEQVDRMLAELERKTGSVDDTPSCEGFCHHVTSEHPDRTTKIYTFTSDDNQQTTIMVEGHSAD